jgi:hypothetical protein
MRFHRRTIRRIRRLAIALAAIGALVPASAAATTVQAHGSGPSANEGAYLRPIASLSAKQYADAYHAALNSGTKLGDTPADFPGVNGSPDATAPIVLVRPERTIVHEANQALPIALSSAALAIVLMGAAFLLVRGRVRRRDVVRAAH